MKITVNTSSPLGQGFALYGRVFNVEVSTHADKTILVDGKASTLLDTVNVVLQEQKESKPEDVKKWAQWLDSAFTTGAVNAEKVNELNAQLTTSSFILNSTLTPSIIDLLAFAYVHSTLPSPNTSSVNRWAAFLQGRYTAQTQAVFGKQVSFSFAPSKVRTHRQTQTQTQTQHNTQRYKHKQQKQNRKVKGAVKQFLNLLLCAISHFDCFYHFSFSLFLT